MEIYQSTKNKTRRTLRKYPDHIEIDVEVFVAGQWTMQYNHPIKYTPELVRAWGFNSIEEFADWKIKRGELIHTSHSGGEVDTLKRPRL